MSGWPAQKRRNMSAVHRPIPLISHNWLCASSAGAVARPAKSSPFSQAVVTARRVRILGLDKPTAARSSSLKQARLSAVNGVTKVCKRAKIALALATETCWPVMICARPSKSAGRRRRGSDPAPRKCSASVDSRREALKAPGSSHLLCELASSRDFDDLHACAGALE